MTEKDAGKNAGDDHRRVVQAIEEHIFQTHKFPSKAQVADLTGIPRAKCDEVIDQLIKQEQLYSVFGGGKGFPEVILPYDMMQGVIMTQKRPDWINDYAFHEKTEIDAKIQQLNKEFVKYDMFERLLYRTDIPLEEAVAFTLDWLGLENVVHHKDRTDYADVTFEKDATLAMVEIEGTTRQGDKRKVLQLDGWIKSEIEKNDREPSTIQGFFVVNHFREDDPGSRGDPLTGQAKKFLSYYRFRVLTTVSLFALVKQVKDNALTREQARERVWNGEEVK